MTKWKLPAAGLLATMLAAAPAGAQISDDVVRLGVLTDITGVYSATTGMGSVAAVRMAVEDFGGTVLGKPIDVVYADHQNKPEIGIATANRWYDVDKVDAIFDVPTSSIALAVQEITKTKNKILMINGGGAADLTGKACSPNSVHYTYDTYALANTMARAGVEMLGKKWFFLTVDYAFGHQLEDGTRAFLKLYGGETVGAVRHPLGINDFSSFLLQGQASGANVIAMANAAGDTVNAIKTAREFGLQQSGQKIAVLLAGLPDIHALGLEAGAGVLLPEAFIWNATPEAEAWSRRFFRRTKTMPSMIQAGNYSSTLHYLKALQAAGTDAAPAVMAKMRATPVNDFFAKNGKIRDDGRMVHDMYLAQIKTPAQSKEAWDYYNIVATVPGDQAFRPMDKGGCPLVAAKP